MTADQTTILFTGFEPSGDDHAAAVIAELKRRHPSLRIAAWGGPKMQAAGAELIERTGDNAVMGLPGLAKIREHRRINKRVEAWIGQNKPAIHVPVDSPAANFPICKIAKANGAKVVHLVAPQIWAWASWRIGKLRRLTDFVCCLLPFEEDYFIQRGVRAQFVGHPLFDEKLDLDALDDKIRDWPADGLRIAIMPGSRPAEIERNFPLLAEAFRTLRADRPKIHGIVAAAKPGLEGKLKELASQSTRTPTWPEGLSVVTGQTDAVVRWCDIALVVSGTVTLQIARQHRPMVVVYKSSRLLYELLGRWLLRTPFCSLPNLLANDRIVPEYVPYFGDHEQIVASAARLLDDAAERHRQHERLARVTDLFSGFNAATSAADVIERVAGLPNEDNHPGDTPAPARPSQSPARRNAIA